jgi:SAM-dependent methyltransferase
LRLVGFDKQHLLLDLQQLVSILRTMKDLFSTQAELYAKFRPTYPPELYDFILGHVQIRQAAWDCATGNGQVARGLAARFERVCATDISENQLRHAVQSDKIQYSISPAERTPFRQNSFDLITVAQAFHWLNPVLFCREATRVAKPGAIVAVWGYELKSVAPAIDRIAHRWNNEMLAPYWEPERQHVVAHYETLLFDFEQLPTRGFDTVMEWDLDDFIGHLQTWSAYQKMKSNIGDGAFLEVVAEIRGAWDEDQKQLCVFSVFLKMGSVGK